jgi:hypothetical protein
MILTPNNKFAAEKITHTLGTKLGSNKNIPASNNP